MKLSSLMCLKDNLCDMLAHEPPYVRKIWDVRGASGSDGSACH